MKAKILQILSVAFAILIIIAGIAGIWIVAKSGIEALNSLSENAKITILVALLGVGSTLGGIIFTKIREKKLQIEANSNIQKQKLYTDFTKLILQLESDPDLANDKEWMGTMRLKFMKSAILWADPKVLSAYHRFRIDSQDNAENEVLVWDISSLFLEFRKDLGLKNKNIDQHLIAEIMYDKVQLAEFYKTYPRKKD